MDAKTYALNIISELTGCPMGSLLGELERAHDKDLPLSCQAEGKMWEERVKRTSEKLRDYAAARVAEAVAPYKAVVKAAGGLSAQVTHIGFPTDQPRPPHIVKLFRLRDEVNAALAALPVEEEGVTGVCPNCNGSKTFPALIGPDAGAIGEADCDYCGGSGYITDAALPLVKALEDADYAYREAYIGYRDVERRIRDDARRALTEYNARKAGEEER